MGTPPTLRALLLSGAIVALGFGWTGSGLGAEPPRQPSLDGTDLHFDYDARDVGRPERAWLGRAFVHRLAADDPSRPLPLVVFLHGTNAQLIKYRWMGGGPEGDVRRIVSELMEAGLIEPVIVAGPSSIMPDAIVNAQTSWPRFELDRFVRLLEERLAGVASIDRGRVIVVAHSGGGCNPKGGLATALQGPLVPTAAISVDTCMAPEVAVSLARARPETRVVVTWQTQGWTKRPFDDFVRVFRREVGQAGYGPDVLRELEHVRVSEPMPHDAMVPVTLRKWLPRLLPPCPPRS